MMIIRVSIILCAGAILGLAGAVTQGALTSSASQTMQAGDGDIPPAVSRDLVARGAQLYERRCGACHSPDTNRVGPKHRGVYGRAAGSVPDFRYSRALGELDVIWTAETLDAWLQNPTAFASGTSMGFRVRKPEEREAIIRYLRSLSVSPDTDTN